MDRVPDQLHQAFRLIPRTVGDKLEHRVAVVAAHPDQPRPDPALDREVDLLVHVCMLHRRLAAANWVEPLPKLSFAVGSAAARTAGGSRGRRDRLHGIRAKSAEHGASHEAALSHV